MRLISLLILAIATPALAEGLPRPGDARALSMELWGCDAPVQDELDNLVTQRDEAAFEKHLMASERAGRCVELKPGTTIVIGSMSFWSGRSEVRVKGDPKVWIVTTQSLVESVK